MSGAAPRARGRPSRSVSVGSTAPPASIAGDPDGGVPTGQCTEKTSHPLKGSGGCAKPTLPEPKVTVPAGADHCENCEWSTETAAPGSFTTRLTAPDADVLCTSTRAGPVTRMPSP